jgi:hypothetical protein
MCFDQNVVFGKGIIWKTSQFHPVRAFHLVGVDWKGRPRILFVFVPVIRGHVCLAETANEPKSIRSTTAVVEFHSEC